MDEPDEFENLPLDTQSNYTTFNNTNTNINTNTTINTTITRQPRLNSSYQSTNLYFILGDDKNGTSRIKHHTNKIIALISKQYNQLGYIDLTIWSNYYYSYQYECCYDCWCCINYNPNYYFNDDTQGYGKCCGQCYGMDIFQESNFILGYIACCIPYTICLPICLFDFLYRKCYGYSRTGLLEYMGNRMLECCVCQCWENRCYINIHTDEMQNVYEIVKNMYSGILEIEMKKYSKNWCIGIKSK